MVRVVRCLGLVLAACAVSTCADATGLSPRATRLFWGSGASAAFVEDSVPLVVFYADSLDHPIGTPRPQVTWQSSDSSVFRILNDTLGAALDTGLVTLSARTRAGPQFTLALSLLVLPRPSGVMLWARSVRANEDPRLVWQLFPGHEVQVIPEYSCPGCPHGRGRFTADRTRIATYAPRPVSPIAYDALYVIDLPGGAARMLLDTMYLHQIWPIWLPGDTLIAFLANRTLAWEVWTVRSDGTDARRRTSLRQPYPPFFDVTPDGNLVIRLFHGGPEADLFELTLDGDTVRRLTSTPGADEGDPAVSPDGQTIAYTINRDDTTGIGPNTEVWLRDRDGAYPRRLVAPHGLVPPGPPWTDPFPGLSGPQSPSWTPDGQFVLVAWVVDHAALNGGYVQFPEIYAIRPSDGRAVRLTRWPLLDGQANSR